MQAAPGSEPPGRIVPPASDLDIDLSHLSAEERKQIEAVLMRAAQMSVDINRY